MRFNKKCFLYVLQIVFLTILLLLDSDINGVQASIVSRLPSFKRKNSIGRNTDELNATRDKNGTKKILNDHGIWNGPDLCGKLDTKTSRLYGEAVCKHYGMQQYKADFKYDYVACKLVLVSYDSKPKSPREDEKEISPNKPQKNVTPVKKNQIKSWPSWNESKENQISSYFKTIELQNAQRAVYCICDSDSAKNVVIINGPAKSFYYVGKIVRTVFQDENNPTLKLFGMEVKYCLKFEINMEDFKRIRIKATNNAREADHIFRVHGVLPRVQKGIENADHVCNSVKNGRTICSTAFDLLNSDGQKYDPMNRPPICVNVILAGFFDNLVFTDHDKTVSTCMLRCWYGNNNHIAVVNTVKEGFYFIALQCEDGKYRIKRCFLY